MRRALARLDRFIAANRYGKRLLFAWQEPDICPSGQTIAFAFDEDYSMGVLSSSIHSAWAWTQSSTLRVDIRYTPVSAFETFPWPVPTPEHTEEVGDLSRQIIERRQQICAEREIGLTTLYNEIDKGAYAQLRDLHAQLDRAVASAYGWPASVATDSNESNRRLLELNKRIATGDVEYEPFSARVAG
jgi:hypothetical protein